MSTLGFPLEDPIRMAELIRYGAEGLRRGASGPDKQLARALGVHRTRANRAKNGDPHSHATRFMLAIAKDSAINAIPMIAEGLAWVCREQIENATADELEAKLHDLTMREYPLLAERNRAVLQYIESDRRAAAHEAVAELDMQLVDVAMERGAIHRELAKRKRLRLI